MTEEIVAVETRGAERGSRPPAPPVIPDELPVLPLREVGSFPRLAIGLAPDAADGLTNEIEATLAMVTAP
ncbi:MAG TPA: hypothetical protein VGB42_00895 [Candidatus Thermoplasmatota archaeon]